MTDCTNAPEVSAARPPIGAVLAGGRGHRIGGEKATAMLGERPLISYATAILLEVLEEVVVVAKADTELPPLDGVAVWREPEQPRHPLVGIVTALQRAEDRPVLICACDLPMITAPTVRRLAEDPRTAAAVIARAGEAWQPLLGCYRPAALRYLAEQLLTHPNRSLQAIVGALGWVPADVPEAELFNVNTPLDLATAATRLGRRRAGH